jgi:hypothetical protein
MIDATRNRSNPVCLFAAILICSLFAFGFAPSAKADTVYTYTGQPFAFFEGLTCPPICGITGSFTLPVALADNLALQIITPSSFSFTDGLTTITNTSVGGGSPLFLVGTNAAGQIYLWRISLTLFPSSGDAGDHFAFFIGYAHGGIGDNSLFADSEFLTAFNGSPGAWSSSTTATPEPSSVLLLAGGLTSLLGFRRKRPSQVELR